MESTLFPTDALRKTKWDSSDPKFSNMTLVRSLT